MLVLLQHISTNSSSFMDYSALLFIILYRMYRSKEVVTT